MIKWKKFKVTKLPAQKSPSRFAGMEASKVAEKSARAKFGEAPEYMGMSQKSMTDLAAESYAMKAENKMFFRTLKKELKASRQRTAAGVKGLRSTNKPVSKPFLILSGLTFSHSLIKLCKYYNFVGLGASP